ncbi:MAG: EAL domain-containing protein [Geminicoccaceae bacterium]
MFSGFDNQETSCLHPVSTLQRTGARPSGPAPPFRSLPKSARAASFSSQDRKSRPFEHRLFRAIACQLLAAIAISILVAYVFSAANLRREFDTAVEGQIESISDVVVGLIERGDYVGVGEVGRVMLVVEHISELQIETASGYELTNLANPSYGTRRRETVELRDRDNLLLGRMIVGFNDERYAENQWMTFIQLIIGLIVFSLTSSVFMMSFVRAAVIEPLVSLSRRLSQHGPENDNMEDVDQFRIEEISTLARLFRRLIADLTRIARTDPVTGIHNRFAFESRIQAIRFPQAGEIAVLLIDIDHFKALNDHHGHFVCDSLLREVGSRLEKLSGRTSSAYRLGGDEFAVIVSGRAEIDRAVAVIGDCFREPVRLPDGNTVELTSSIGIARAPDDARNARDLLHVADIALYEAKGRGRNQIVHYSRPCQRDSDKPRHAFDRKQRRSAAGKAQAFHFQPIHDLRNGDVWGYEMLLRSDEYEWLHMALAPQPAVCTVRKARLVDQFNHSMLDAAGAFFDTLREPARESVAVTMNCSVDQILCRSLVTALRDAITCDRIAGQRIVIEIAHCKDLERPEVIEVLEEMRDMGIRIALDHFGAGLAPAESPGAVPLDMVKLHRDLMLDPHSLEHVLPDILRTLKDLQLPIVADGIEEPETRKMAIEAGIQFAQGQLFGEPRPLSHIRTSGNGRNTNGAVRSRPLHGRPAWAGKTPVASIPCVETSPLAREHPQMRPCP